MVDAAIETIYRLGSSVRVCDPRDTFERAAALMARFGISRVTDITRLDFLGVPVFTSVRPRGQTLRVHAGKGVNQVEARVGALMEALEYAVAEPQRSRWQSRSMSRRELESAWDGRFTFHDLAPRFGQVSDPGLRFDTIECEALAGRSRMPLPADLIFVPFESTGSSGLLRWSTNGLASGNSLAEATLHGLLEVLERDAEAMSRAGDESLWVDPKEWPALVLSLTSTWGERGVELDIRYLPNAFGLPCFEAVVNEPGSTTVDAAAGFGLHVDRDIALVRAVCEAAQSRLSHIHGGRDDVTEFFDGRSKLGRSAGTPDIPKDVDRCRAIAYQEIPQAGDDGGIEETLSALLEHLGELDFGEVLRHKFDVPLDGLAVVKIVIPRCENSAEPFEHLGPRMLARLLADA